MTVKTPILFGLIVSFLLFSTPLFAETQTLTTYYPAPSGNYNKIQTNSMQLTASTLSAIQAKYNCSYDPSAGLPACPEGLMFFNTATQTIYVSVGTSWTSVNATCVPVTACSATLNCGNDNCGDLCGNLQGKCPAGQNCSSSTPGIPGTCT